MDRFIREIAITEIDGVSIGHAQDNEAKTGASVLYFKRGAQAGCDISGGGPASRETPLTDSMTADNPLNAVVLSGGSAYGLAASDGVMRCLEEQGIGYDTGFPKYLLYVSPAFLTWDTEEAISVRMRIWDMRPVERRWKAAMYRWEMSEQEREPA